MNIERGTAKKDKESAQDRWSDTFGDDNYDINSEKDSFENKNSSICQNTNETIEDSGFNMSKSSKETVDNLLKDTDNVEEDFKGNKRIRLDVIPPRTDVEFKIDDDLKETYKILYEVMKSEKGYNYKKLSLWGEVITIGYENLPSFDVPGLLEQFKIVRKKIITISRMESQPSVDFSVGTKTILHLSLTINELKKIEEIQNKYFVREPHKSAPYVMLIVSFINSDYAKCLKSLRWAVEPYTRDIKEHIKSMENKLYNTNIRILENWLKIPPDEMCYFIDYLNYFTAHVKDYNNPDIKKQAELIIEFCENIKEYKNMYKKVNTDFSNEKFDKLIEWAEKYENRGGQQERSKEDSSTEKPEVSGDTGTKNK
jgi:hypothetical protein